VCAVETGERQRFGIDLNEVDAYLAALVTAATDAELRAGFATYRAEHPSVMPTDPRSPEFLSGRAYATSNEVTSFDHDRAVVRPFPYATGSAQVVGDHLMLIGQVVRLLGALPPRATVLDCGAGWGGTTLALAQAGLQVTALEVDPAFVRLLTARAAREQAEIEVIHGDYLTAFQDMTATGRTFDAVLFFESFHHCDDPNRLVSMLDAVVAPGGIAVFASEPILDEFPVPWGVRLDGESLWAIRQNGWLELGFQPEFFRSMLLAHGWLASKVSTIPSHPSGFAFVARRVGEWTTTWTPTSGLLTAVGDWTTDALTTTARDGFVMFGPYASLPPGPWRFTIHLDPQAVASGRAVVEVAFAKSTQTLARRVVTLDASARTIDIDADVPFAVEDLEVRVAFGASTRLRITQLDAVRLASPVVNRIDSDGRQRVIDSARRVRTLLPVGSRLHRLTGRAGRRLLRTLR
jgi:SAM-dependent methyltransferase